MSAGGVEALTEAEWMPVEDRLIALWQCETEAGYDEFAGRVQRAVERIITSRLAAVRREAERKALTEAADDVPMFEFMLTMDIAAEVAPGQIGAWLRDRAARIGGAS